MPRSSTQPLALGLLLAVGLLLAPTHTEAQLLGSLLPRGTLIDRLTAAEGPADPPVAAAASPSPAPSPSPIADLGLGSLASRIGSRLGLPATTTAPAPSPASSPVACPVSPTNTTLNFTGIRTKCVATDVSPTFCTSCVCALLDLYTPAFAAAGLLKGPADVFMNSAMGVITSCTSAFLGPLIASGTDLAGLQRLASQCNFSATNVPSCLVATISAMNTTNATMSATNATMASNMTATNMTATNMTATPNMTATNMTTTPNVTAASGDSDFLPDTTLNSDVLAGAGKAIPITAGNATAPAPAQTPVPAPNTQTPVPATVPAPTVVPMVPAPAPAPSMNPTPDVKAAAPVPEITVPNAPAGATLTTASSAVSTLIMAVLSASMLMRLL